MNNPIIPDPSEIDAFKSHRTGYSQDNLTRVMNLASAGWDLKAGEGLVLVKKIKELEEELHALRADVVPTTNGE